MKLSKNIKIISIIMILFFTIIINCSYTYAASAGDIVLGADDFISDGEANQKIAQSSLQDLSGTIYNTLFIIGVAIATIVGVVLGIEFVTGSIEQKSKIKESLIPYFAGCVVIFGAFGIWKLIVIILSAID